ncbi:MAG TPA: M13 family metallopeptidase [Rhizomicrobium sp.]|nr:M13 family metallopeptidase [Rhizomicrobium sp.]
MPKIATAALAGAALLACAALAADAPKPLYGAWGLDTAGMDTKVKPGDDFFDYANGTWLAGHTIPADKPAVSLRLEMTDRTEARLHDMMEAEAARVSHRPGDLAGKVGAFYKAFMDEKGIEAAGAKPIAPELDKIKSAKSRDDLAGLQGAGVDDFYGELFAVYSDVDLKNTGRYAIYLSQSGLGLPDRDYYLEKGFAAQKAAYAEYAATLLKLVNWPDADARARDVVDFETKLAAASWTRVQDRDPVATYNPMSVDQLQKLTPGFDWKAYLAAAQLPALPRVIVAEKSAFPKLSALYASTPVPVLQAWLAVHVADNAAPFLDSRFTGAYFKLHDQTLAGQKQQRVRWKRAVTAVAGGDFLATNGFGAWGTMGFGVGQLYTAKYFGPDSKAKIEALVHNLLDAYAARLKNVDWMSPATKAEALKKLETYTIKVGYPDHPRDYSKVVITDDDVTGDVRAAAAADWAYYTGRLNDPVDKLDWGMTPQTNDAYNGTLRDIVFPAGILQAPVFDANADPAINYGAVGAIIGHEMTHGFDDQGRKFDAQGNLRDWWTKDDAARFDARAKRLGAQYSQFAPLANDPKVHVNGDLTMGENIADLGGLTLALDAYHASLHGKPAPVIGGLTGDQRVFLGWAQAWRGKVTDDFVRRQVVSDPHSPRQFRVNGVVHNIDAWYAAFGVKPGDKLYVAPKDRVHIW